MEKITEYFLVVEWLEPEKGAHDLTGKVNAKVRNGYQPFGSPFVLTVREPSLTNRSTQICQAMVKYR